MSACGVRPFAALRWRPLLQVPFTQILSNDDEDDNEQQGRRQVSHSYSWHGCVSAKGLPLTVDVDALWRQTLQHATACSYVGKDAMMCID